MKEIKEQAENGFGFTSAKALFKSLGLKLSSFEYRKAGAKDGSHNWPVLRVRFEVPQTTKYWEEDLNLRDALTPSDVKALEGKTVVDFGGFWGTYVERSVDAKTGEIIVTSKDADWPKVIDLKLSDGTTFAPHGGKIEFGGIGYVAEPAK